MSARPSRKISARARVFFSALFIVTVAIILASGPRPSKATQQPGMPEASHKRTRPAFVPGEALVRYKSESIAKRVLSQMTLAVNAHEVPIQIEIAFLGPKKLPEVGRSRQPSRFKSVLLPEPDGPMMAM